MSGLTSIRHVGVVQHTGESYLADVPELDLVVVDVPVLNPRDGNEGAAAGLAGVAPVDGVDRSLSGCL